MERTIVYNEAKQLLAIAMNVQTFSVIIHKEDDMYIAECPEVGTVDQGETIERAIEGLKEATRLYLEHFPVPATAPRLLTS